jgi:hypothetical protein
MVGNGQIGTQPTATDVALPASTVIAIKESAAPSASSSSGTGSGESNSSNNNNGASSLGLSLSMGAGIVGVVVGALML